MGPLLLAYDAECSLCRRMMDWVRRRDPEGLVIAFPLQDPELVKVAPELAGRPLHEAIHGLDLATRRVYVGADLLPHVGRRLPGWRWVAPLSRLPGLPALAAWIYEKMASRRACRRGRTPSSR